MGITEKRRKEIFSQLDDMASLNRENLEKEFPNYDESTIHDLVSELCEVAVPCYYGTSKEFVDCIYQLKAIKSEWSRKTGHMLLAIDNLIQKQDKFSAIEHIEGFISSCDIPYFRGVAENEKTRLIAESIVGGTHP